MRTGDLPTAKRLRQWLAELGTRRRSHSIPRARGRTPTAPSTHILPRPDHALSARARAAGTGWRAGAPPTPRPRAALEAELGDGLSEPAVARQLLSRLGAQETLWVASSMPIRDVEAFAPLRDDGPRRVVQPRRQRHRRDGAERLRRRAPAPTARSRCSSATSRCAHDAGGLLAHRRHGLELRIVVIDNDGGGIFHFLPVAG